MRGIGIDIGTNSLCAAKLDDSGVVTFQLERDAFFRIEPKSDVNQRSIRSSLERRKANFIEEGTDFIVVGQDALQIAMERNSISSRPMAKGVISPKDKNNLPMLKLLISSLIGKGGGNTPLVYSVPAKPIDMDFDIHYHTNILNMFFMEQGFISQPINEAFAIGLSELLDEGLCGICCSLGAGQVNFSVIHEGSPLIEFSTTMSGDYIDKSVATALDLSPALIQLEKEDGIDLYKPTNKITEAVAVYYSTVLNYTLQNLEYELKRRAKDLPIFREAVPIVVSGGLTLAGGFVTMFEEKLSAVKLPIKISEVRAVESPMTCVANGCLLASQL